MSKIVIYFIFYDFLLKQQFKIGKIAIILFIFFKKTHILFNTHSKHIKITLKFPLKFPHLRYLD